jgi:hypothetical protein
VTHIARACDYLDVVQGHLDAAKDEPEAPVEFIELMQVFLHDVWLLLDGHARRRWTYDEFTD